METKSPILPDHITIHIEDKTYMLSRNGIKLAIWNKIPLMIRDPESPDAKMPENQLMRVAIKAAIRGIVPNMLKKMFGDQAPQPPPKTDLLQWICNLMIHVIVDQLSVQEWKVNVEQCHDCESAVFKVQGVTTYAYPDSATKIHTNTDDH